MRADAAATANQEGPRALRRDRRHSLRNTPFPKVSGCRKGDSRLRRNDLSAGSSRHRALAGGPSRPNRPFVRPSRLGVCAAVRRLGENARRNPMAGVDLRQWCPPQVGMTMARPHPSHDEGIDIAAARQLPGIAGHGTTPQRARRRLARRGNGPGAIRGANASRRCPIGETAASGPGVSSPEPSDPLDRIRTTALGASLPHDRVPSIPAPRRIPAGHPHRVAMTTLGLPATRSPA